MEKTQLDASIDQLRASLNPSAAPIEEKTTQAEVEQTDAEKAFTPEELEALKAPEKQVRESIDLKTVSYQTLRELATEDQEAFQELQRRAVELVDQETAKELKGLRRDLKKEAKVEAQKEEAVKAYVADEQLKQRAIRGDDQAFSEILHKSGVYEKAFVNPPAIPTNSAVETFDINSTVDRAKAQAQAENEALAAKRKRIAGQ